MFAEPITVSNNWIRAVLQRAERLGVDTEAELARVGVEPARLNDESARIGIDETVRIWQACAAASGDAHFGLHFGANVRPGTFHIVGYTLMNSTTLQGAFEKLQRYQRLISDGGVLQQVPMREGIWLIYHTRPERMPFCYHQIDAALAAIVSFSRILTSHEFSPLRVCFQRPAPDSVAEYERILGCPVHFDAQFDGVLTTEAALATPLPDADDELCELHERIARRRLAQLERAGSWQEQTREIIARRLADKRLCRRTVAEQLRLSERSLRRKLAEEGTSFQRVLDETRRQHALSLIAERGVGLGAVGERVGFADPSAFYRAFRRWTGTTPGAYRRAG
jgi:AraC-like DNA-binding protein